MNIDFFVGFLMGIFFTLAIILIFKEIMDMIDEHIQRRILEHEEKKNE